MASSFGGLGVLAWAVPSLVLTVPGLLLMLAVIGQIVGAAVWMPVVRRSLGVFGLGRSAAHSRASRVQAPPASSRDGADQSK